jgi:multicomponent Na+:H+ antiporter subunit G
MIAGLLALAGAVLILLSALGVVRFGDVLERMHALSKASTLGLLLVMAGGVVGLNDVNDWTFVLLAGVLQLVTSPVGANLISRATYRAEGIRHRVDVVDELAEAGVDED